MTYDDASDAYYGKMDVRKQMPDGTWRYGQLSTEAPSPYDPMVWVTWHDNGMDTKEFLDALAPTSLARVSIKRKAPAPMPYRAPQLPDPPSEPPPDPCPPRQLMSHRYVTLLDAEPFMEICERIADALELQAVLSAQIAVPDHVGAALDPWRNELLERMANRYKARTKT